MGPLLLLGPQRPAPNLVQALDANEVRGPLVAITAGWRFDEVEIGPLQRHVQRPFVHLPLYAWFEEVMASDAALARVYHERQERIRGYKELYQLRLSPILDAVDALIASPARSGPLAEHAASELEDALEDLRDLDARMLHHLQAIRRATPELERAWELPSVRGRYEEVGAALEKAGSVAVAGGHVGVLLNRMKLFGLGKLLPEFRARGGCIASWSGGAMVLSERIVLYYDDPPDGQGEAQPMDYGLGLIRGMVVFPHARRRLRLSDDLRLQALVSRFYPDTCVGMENGAWLQQHKHEVWVDRSIPGTLLHLDRTPLPPPPSPVDDEVGA